MSNGLSSARGAMEWLGLPPTDTLELRDSDKRFGDGGQYRVEIPSVEGPDVMEAVIQEAIRRRVPIHRISQGSGIMLQTDAELDAMVQLGEQYGVEVCLFIGPRALWDIGAQASATSGGVVGPALRGADQLAYAVADVERACKHGVRSILVADLGALFVLARMRTGGLLPADLVLKASVSLPAANPASARVLEDLGASTINVPSDLTLAQLTALRTAVDLPVDVYIESPDDFGGMIRHHEVAEIVRVASPVHLKFGLRNAPAVYPSGEHLRAMVLAMARERVRRTEIGLGLLRAYYPNAAISAGGDLGGPSTL